MGFRFRKSINVILGDCLNLSNGTPSLNLGPRGAFISFGSWGTYANLSLPGVGLSYRTRLDRAASSRDRNQTVPYLGLRQTLEQEAAELTLAVTAIRIIHELTLDPKTGTNWEEQEAAYLHNITSLFFKFQHRYVQKSQNALYYRKSL